MTSNMIRGMTLVLLAAAGFCAGCATTSTDSDQTPRAKAEAIIQAVQPGLVRVEYTLQYDKGDSPTRGGVLSGNDDDSNYGDSSLEQLIEQERPYEVAGYVLSPTMVLTGDPGIHPRFIQALAVRDGSRVITAKPVAYARNQRAIYLELSQPLPQAQPLKFDASLKPPYHAVAYNLRDASWTTSVRGFSETLLRNEAGQKILTLPGESLVVNEQGKPVGLTTSYMDPWPADDSWKGSPQDWPKLSAKEYEQALTLVQKQSEQGMLRATLRFRSPKASARPTSRMDDEDGDPSNPTTERHVLSLLLNTDTLLILADMPPRVTARLERITVHPPTGAPVEAKFAGSLKDYGVLVAKLPKPIGTPLPIAPTELAALRPELLIAADITLKGEQRIAYFGRSRLMGFNLGRYRQVFPMVVGDNSTFLFDLQGRLVIAPMILRPKVNVSETQNWRHRNNLEVIPLTRLQPILAQVASHIDPNNVPLSEDDENRLAWLGVELQALNPELARMNNVSDQTNDGRTGVMVTYIYPDSPATKLKLQMGDILLRFFVKDFPKPLEIRGQGEFGSQPPFPWEQLGQVPEQYFERLSQYKPWPAADNSLNRLLTDLGFGKLVTLEYVRDGKVLRQDFNVAQGPSHYDSAPKYKSEAMGVTVKELTYEIRRYFQLAADAPGLILAKVEMGSKASVAGLKPFEVVTHVNDKPVAGVKDFETAVARGGELRLSIKRMDKGRTIKIVLPTAATQPAPGE